MARRESIEDLVETGFLALDDDDREAAGSALARALEQAPTAPEVLALAAAVAGADGDDERALDIYAQLAAADPEDPMPLINAAAIYLHDRGDADAALAQLEQAEDRIDDDDALTMAIVLKAEALLTFGDDIHAKRAREALKELTSSTFDDPEQLLELGGLWLDAGDAKSAIPYFTRAAELAGEEEAEELQADANHGLGHAQMAAGDRDKAIAAWQVTRALDATVSTPDWSPDAKTFDAQVRAVIAALPAKALTYVDKAAIAVDAQPSEALVSEGVDPRALVIFQGTSASEGSAKLTTIRLFQRNVEAVADNALDLDEQIRVATLVEAANFFNIDEEDLDQLGLGASPSDD